MHERWIQSAQVEPQSIHGMFMPHKAVIHAEIARLLVWADGCKQGGVIPLMPSPFMRTCARRCVLVCTYLQNSHKQADSPQGRRHHRLSPQRIPLLF